MSIASPPAPPQPDSARKAPTTTYDDIPYSVCAFPQTSPDRLATIATLFAMSPAPAGRCRVLELGCASGGNIIPMALIYPNSHFMGIDISGRQIADGQAAVGELGIPNVELRHASITDFDSSEQFDYILAHGVYSWVPPDVQASILHICKHNLAPQGVAYISYNCYPGWHARGAIREMLCYHTQQFTDPAQKVRASRGLIALLGKSAAASGDGGYSALMRQELAILLLTPDTYLLHEHLEEYNEPLYFHQFAQRAADSGLQYLAEAHMASMVASRFGPEVESTIRQISPDLLHMEQYLDFLRNRMFRQTLLCHADLKLDHMLHPHTVEALHVSSAAESVGTAADLQSDSPAQYKAPGNLSLETRDPLMKAAMAALRQQWPASIPFGELVRSSAERLGRSDAPSDADRQQLAGRLLNCYVSGIVELSTCPSPFTSNVSSHPLASPYARYRAREGGKVVNMKLQTVPLGEPACTLLRHLDGAHDAGSLARVIAEWLQASVAKSPDGKPLTPEMAQDRAAEYVNNLLPKFAEAALLLK